MDEIVRRVRRYLPKGEGKPTEPKKASRTRTMSKGMKRSVITVIINGLIFLGCILFLSQCAPAPTRKPPIVRAVAQELPVRSTRILVYQKDQSYERDWHNLAEQEAIMWFQAKGLTVIERNRIHTALAEQSFSMRLGEDAKVLNAGKMLGAQQIVFLSVDYSYVTLRAIETETGRILWTGTASYPPDQFEGYGDITSPLVRKTLDAVWASLPNSSAPRGGMQ